MEMIEFSKKCPICSIEFKNVFKVKLILLNEIRDTICFKKLVSCKNANYFDFPYLAVYYEESFEFTVNKLIYQAWDGQPYFLSENIVKKIKKENKEAPSLIFGMIRKITPKIIKKYKNLTCLSPHLHDDSVIYIVEIETS
ncbi:RING finger protein [Vairimorpha necatrix]